MYDPGHACHLYIYDIIYMYTEYGRGIHIPCTDCFFQAPCQLSSAPGALPSQHRRY